MANNKTLHDAFIDELRDVYHAEKQLLKALPKMARTATSEELRNAFETHVDDTQGQVDRLERVFAMLDEKARGKHCAGIAGIIEEGQSIMSEDFDAPTMDACLVGAAQRAEHYEIAAYGALVAWANTLGLSEAAALLEETLGEEKATDEALSALAEGGLNAGAAGQAEEDEDDDEAMTVSARESTGGGRSASGQARSTAGSAKGVRSTKR